MSPDLSNVAVVRPQRRPMVDVSNIESIVLEDSPVPLSRLFTQRNAYRNIRRLHTTIKQRVDMELLSSEEILRLLDSIINNILERLHDKGAYPLSQAPSLYHVDTSGTIAYNSNFLLWSFDHGKNSPSIAQMRLWFEHDFMISIGRRTRPSVSLWDMRYYLEDLLYLMKMEGAISAVDVREYIQ